MRMRAEGGDLREGCHLTTNTHMAHTAHIVLVGGAQSPLGLRDLPLALLLFGQQALGLGRRRVWCMSPVLLLRFSSLFH